MDRIKETADLIISINKYRNRQLQDFELIEKTCAYFDKIKEEKIGQADLRFLKYTANVIGIPHFYDLLDQFEHQLDLEDYDVSTVSSLIYEASLHTTETNKVHKYQKAILDLFIPDKLNRYFLSASTSFGKTHVVFELVKKMNYQNVLLVFPTIALLSENLEKVLSDPNYGFFKENYTIHTLSEVKAFGQCNLFIYTPERFLSFIEKNEEIINFNFAFIDEIYKIDNDYLIDDETRENERDVAYRLSVFYTLKPNVDVLMAGPYIDFSRKDQPQYNRSFDDFLTRNQVTLIDYNRYEIVNKSYSDIKTAKKLKADDRLELDFSDNNKTNRLCELVNAILKIDQNAIIYCSSRSKTEFYAKKIIASGVLEDHNRTAYAEFASHIAKYFGKDWVLYQALQSGIGIHHGLIPKYIQKEIIALFNKGVLKVLLSTTTITEGVNTSAKNLIVLHSKKGIKDLKKFDAKNIAGRAGRFLYHYSGRVLVLQNDFMKAINAESEGIKHKNYDMNSPKDEIDLFYTNEEYLNDSDRTKKIDIAKQQEIRGIPDFVFNLYKVISRSDKIIVYDRILNLDVYRHAQITALISRLNYQMDIDTDGFQVVINVLTPIIRNQKLLFLVTNRDRNERYSVLTHFVHFYLDGGFLASMNYKINPQGKSKDDAIKETAEFVYSILKYQVVKYLGVFNIMYKLIISKQRNVHFDDVVGIDRLLTKLEYNALSEEGRLASDYGVPANVLNFYEATDEQNAIKSKFDNYELAIYQKIDKIINGANNNTADNR